MQSMKSNLKEDICQLILKSTVTLEHNGKGWSFDQPLLLSISGNSLLLVLSRITTDGIGITGHALDFGRHRAFRNAVEDLVADSVH